MKIISVIYKCIHKINNCLCFIHLYNYLNLKLKILKYDIKILKSENNNKTPLLQTQLK